jgi:hypothetical protein
MSVHLQRGRRRRGFTLAEMLVYLSLVTTGMVVIGGLEVQSTKALEIQQILVDLQLQSSALLGSLRRDVEQARSIESDRGALRIRRLDGVTVSYEAGARLEVHGAEPARRTTYLKNTALVVHVDGSLGGRSPIVTVEVTFEDHGLRRVYTGTAAPRREVTGG